MPEKKLRFETLQLHAGQESPDSATDARAVPIYMTTSYVFEDTAQATARFDLSEPGNIYTRLMNPTTDVFEKRINVLEGGVGALATSSGAAAVTIAVQNIAHAGDHIVSAAEVYGGTYNLFAHTFQDFGIDATFVNGDDSENFAKAIQPNTKLIFIETMGNPNASLIDIEAVAKIAHDNGIPLLVDSTFATPYLFRPLEHGADIVIHSATKFIGGHGTALGGVIIDGGTFDWDASGKFPCLTEPVPSYHGVKFTEAAGKAAYITKARVALMRDVGSTLSPFHSFLFLQGLETLSLRVERHMENTLKVVEFLSKHPKIEKVNHPSLPDNRYNSLYKKYFPKGAGSIFTIEIKGGAKEAMEFVDKLKVFSLLANVADAKSLVIHPGSTTHSQMNEEELAASGIKPNSIRLSIGLEHIDDILEDLDQAL
ncbi:O-acetylhomoserine aminocarboxypropyltransferase/cysteine synthase family protein [Parasporobacterium paucivorans]|uniref:O-acetylhomoserine (Thiol)-lyase n=1 Tax=Parasporobacterium paucivorans DSM 15970 TaxID=1122934 RepID=A0A1M6KL54_9FIRM|nr:O-acetylhomoserine aminocarboxypropyltransferase/cysteine synthase family protein [Parasporobacterium paucivorans]SHJ59561.1 O-acetylhomoserine (thiol)-lyase [Parasporobacterium paucivorans DSM 15970]